VIRWIPNKLSDSCVSDITRKRRNTWSAWDARNAYIDSLGSEFRQHFSSEIARGIRVSAMHVWHQHYIFCCLYATEQGGIVTQFDDAECPFHEHKSSVLYFTKLQATSPEACAITRDSHVRSEFEKQSDSGTSVASDPAHGDPCNVQ